MKDVVLLVAMRLMVTATNCQTMLAKPPLQRISITADSVETLALRAWEQVPFAKMDAAGSDV